ncbi:MAG: GlyGly-CTERM sorting domain-containing protein [Glaciecola sp.]
MVIPLSEYASVVDLTNTFQLKVTGSGTVYLDNIYFSKTVESTQGNSSTDNSGSSSGSNTDNSNTSGNTDTSSGTSSGGSSTTGSSTGSSNTTTTNTPANSASNSGSSGGGMSLLLLTLLGICMYQRRRPLAN